MRSSVRGSLLLIGVGALALACGGGGTGGGSGGGAGGGNAGGGGGGTGGSQCGGKTCHAAATCDTSFGGLARCVCSSGYRDATGDGTQCEDIDECADGTATCPTGATCSNTDGAFSCACGPGFTGDGQSCTRQNSWLSISAGASEFTCGVLTGGSLWCWGRDDENQVGNGGFTAYSPKRMGTDSDWAQASAGYTHGCAIKSTGALYCWGENIYGAVGVANVSPGVNRVGTDTNWERVSAGTDHTCATKTDHTAWCWGLNSQGQLGGATPYATQRSTPVQVDTGTNWKMVGAGALQSCGVKMDGTLWCWGANTSGQLGIGNNGTTRSNVPVQVGTLTTWATVSTGTNLSCATRTDGTLWCWGVNTDGQLCAGSSVFGSQYTPVQAGTDTNWESVSAGGTHTCARKATGAIYCCGGNAQGELGNGTNSPSRDLVQVGQATDWANVHAGAVHSCALKNDKSAYCWGDNGSGELGAVGADSNVPIPVP